MGMASWGHLWGEGGHGHNHMEAHVIFKGEGGHPLDTVCDARCRRMAMVADEASLLGRNMVLESRGVDESS